MDNKYQLYLNKVVELAETIVIKSVAAASAINKRLVELYGPLAVGDDPTTWKYYLNLAGEYHPSNQVMTVVSMDTQETIVFSKENLAIHRATARAYTYGTQQYQQLVAQYPGQENLILGILYPVDKHAAINAADGAILGYPKHLVEANEYNFIPKLQAWIDGFMARWVVRGFSVTDSLYTATWMMIQRIFVVPAILTIRLGACKTNEAHSFHVRKYLASHGLNENHLEYLTMRQSLWLYRNIDYLQRHIGKQENLELLIEHLLTERNLPIAEYTMRHNVTSMPDEIYPEITFRKKNMNIGQLDLVPVSMNVMQILDKQDQFARANQQNKIDKAPLIQEVMENASSNVVMTKLLESTVVDYGDGTPYTKINVLFHHWIYLASHGVYTAFIGVTNPRTGERFQISVKDAVTLACYAFACAHGSPPVYVEQIIAERVQRMPTPLAEELRSIADPELVSLADAQMLLAKQPGISTIISTEAFYNTCIEIYHAQQHQRGMMALQEHSVKRAMIQNMAARIYSDTVCTLEPSGTMFSSWLSERNIDLQNFTEADFHSVYEAIVQDATGMSLHNTTSIKSIQRAMVGLLSGLSSYSIQINAEVNGSDLVVLDNPQVRLGDVDMEGHDYVPVQEISAVIQDATHHQHTVQQFDLNPCGEREVLTAETHMGDLVLNSAVSVAITDGGRQSHMHYQMPLVRMKVITPLAPNDRGVIVVPGIPEYLALTPEQQLDVIDMYDTGLPPLIPHTEYDDPNQIENVLRQNILSGLTYNPDQQS